MQLNWSNLGRRCGPLLREYKLFVRGQPQRGIFRSIWKLILFLFLTIILTIIYLVVRYQNTETHPPVIRESDSLDEELLRIEASLEGGSLQIVDLMQVSNSQDQDQQPLFRNHFSRDEEVVDSAEDPFSGAVSFQTPKSEPESESPRDITFPTVEESASQQDLSNYLAVFNLTASPTQPQPDPETESRPQNQNQLSTSPLSGLSASSGTLSNFTESEPNEESGRSEEGEGSGESEESEEREGSEVNITAIAPPPPPALDAFSYRKAAPLSAVLMNPHLRSPPPPKSVTSPPSDGKTNRRPRRTNTKECDSETRARMKGLPESFPPKDAPFMTKVHAKEDDERWSWLHEGPMESLKRYQFESCAVVGNSGVLLKTKFGDAIDSHSVVMRMNQAPVEKNREQVGKKTTFRLLNKLWTDKYGGVDGVGNRVPSRPVDNLLPHGSGRRVDPAVLPVEKNVTLLATRADAKLISKLHLKYNNQTKHRSKNVQVLSMHPGITGSAKKLMDQYRTRIQSCVGLSGQETGGAGGLLQGPTTPSSGLVGVYMLMYLCQRLDVYGFGTDSSVPYQYYRLFNTERREGATDIHSFNLEFSALEALSRDGYITLCGTESPKTCGQR